MIFSRPFLSAARALFSALAAALAFQGAFAANLAPKVSIITPSFGQKFSSPADVQIIVQADDAEGVVESVELFTDLGSLGKMALDVQTFRNPLEWTWRNPPAGEHKLVAQAIDNEGAVSFSESVLIVVVGDSIPGAASLVITKPANGSAFAPSDTIPIELDAVDPNGDIRHVELFANDRLIGTLDHLTKEAVIPGRTLHYYFEWKVAEAGAYQIQAKAVDTLQNPVLSRPVTVTVGPSLPIVSIKATTFETTEPSPNTRVKPGVFTLHRTGDTGAPLTVSLLYDGSATPGVDYEALPKSVTFAAGEADVTLLVQAFEDNLPEGLETVAAILIGDRFDRIPDHVFDPGASAAKILIHDSNVSSEASLELTWPKDGAVYHANEGVKITATAIDPKGYIARVEFYDFDKQIGVSQIEFFRAPDPGTPIFHDFEWLNPGEGAHVLTARALDSSGKEIRSREVRIQVQGAGQSLPLVSITALDREATEFSAVVDAVDPAQFEISRDSDLDHDLVVFLSLHGTASPGVDYKDPGQTVVIPAGEAHTTLTIVPLWDDLDETMETVTVRLEASRGFRADYVVQPALAEAVAVIYERSRPEKPALELAYPGTGEFFDGTQSIPLIAAAFPSKADLSHVDFFAGEELIASSDILFAQISPANLIIHRADWKSPAPGKHVLTARAKQPDGSVVLSSKVEVSVGDTKAVPPTQVRNIEKRPTGNMRLQITGPENQSCIVEYSTDLIHWQALDPVLLQSGTISIEDEVGAEKQKFYRTRVP